MTGIRSKSRLYDQARVKQIAQQRFKKQQLVEKIHAKVNRESLMPCQTKITQFQTEQVNRLMRFKDDDGRLNNFKQLVYEDQAQQIDRIANQTYSVMNEMSMSPKRNRPIHREIENTKIVRPNFRTLGRMNEASKIFER